MKAIRFICAIASTVMICSCSNDDYSVTPPSWKGFDYSINSLKDIQANNLTPPSTINWGDTLKVTMVRKEFGHLVGQIRGTIYVLYTLTDPRTPQQTIETGDTLTIIHDAEASTADYQYNCYAKVIIQAPDYQPQGYSITQIQTACLADISTFGSNKSEIIWNDLTSHESPYIGSSYVTKVDVMNGAQIVSSTSNEDTTLHYYTLWQK